MEYVTVIHSNNEETEPVVGGVGDDDAEADPEAEEGLRDGRVPDPGLQQPLPLRREEECEAGGGPGQREAAHQQHRQHQVREQRREVGHLARALHSCHNSSDETFLNLFHVPQPHLYTG